MRKRDGEPTAIGTLDCHTQRIPQKPAQQTLETGPWLGLGEIFPKPNTIHLPKVHSQAITSPQTLTYFRGNNGIRFESKFSAFDNLCSHFAPGNILPLIKALFWFGADESLHKYQRALTRQCYQTYVPQLQSWHWRRNEPPKCPQELPGYIRASVLKILPSSWWYCCS